MMRSVEAVFCIPLATALTAGAMVGIGLGVDEGGGGSTQTSPLSSNIFPI